MLSILLVTFPFFALVLCGYLAARRGLLPQAAIPGLNAFVLYFALPCMLFRFGADGLIESFHADARGRVVVVGHDPREAATPGRRSCEDPTLRR